MGNHFRKTVFVAALIATSACSEPSPQWRYERTRDALRDFTNVKATIHSEKDSAGVSAATLVIERKAGLPDTGYIDDKYRLESCDPKRPYLMRLDDGPIEPIPCVDLSDGHLAHLWKQIPASTIRRIERANVVVVEAPYSPGPIQYTFQVKGLRL